MKYRFLLAFLFFTASSFAAGSTAAAPKKKTLDQMVKIVGNMITDEGEWDKTHYTAKNIIELCTKIKADEMPVKPYKETPTVYFSTSPFEQTKKNKIWKKLSEDLPNLEQDLNTAKSHISSGTEPPPSGNAGKDKIVKALFKALKAAADTTGAAAAADTTGTAAAAAAAAAAAGSTSLAPGATDAAEADEEETAGTTGGAATDLSSTGSGPSATPVQATGSGPSATPAQATGSGPSATPAQATGSGPSATPAQATGSGPSATDAPVVQPPLSQSQADSGNAAPQPTGSAVIGNPGDSAPPAPLSASVVVSNPADSTGAAAAPTPGTSTKPLKPRVKGLASRDYAVLGLTTFGSVAATLLVITLFKKFSKPSASAGKTPVPAKKTTKKVKRVKVVKPATSSTPVTAAPAA